MLEREFKNHSLNLNRMIREGRMEKESRLHKNQEFEHILFSIGDGSIRSEEVRRWFADDPSSVTASTPESPAQPEESSIPACYLIYETLPQFSNAWQASFCSSPTW